MNVILHIYWHIVPLSSDICKESLWPLGIWTFTINIYVIRCNLPTNPPQTILTELHCMIDSFEAKGFDSLFTLAAKLGSHSIAGNDFPVLAGEPVPKV